jgi:cystathionine beta-lyase/cystathionine gamma-synthase
MQVGGDTLDMKTAMSKLKQQALQFTVKAQQASNAARLEREEAAGQLQDVTEQLQQAKSQVSGIKCIEVHKKRTDKCFMAGHSLCNYHVVKNQVSGICYSMLNSETNYYFFPGLITHYVSMISFYLTRNRSRRLMQRLSS